jgi:predicted metal-dependent phosphoesterase TrpH
VNNSPGFVDLHLHTTASDGAFSPTQIVHMALEAGLRAVAITDHDSMDGLEEAVTAAAGTGLVIIPGVEISSDLPQGEAHILGYYLDAHNAELVELLATLRKSRWERAQRMVEKLGGLGLPVSWDRVAAIADGGAVGRPHVARALMEAGHVSSVQDAFALYIGREGPAYVDRYKLAPVEVTRQQCRQLRHE